jgi:hypothetical protein
VLITYPGDLNCVKHWHGPHTEACSCIHKTVNVLSMNKQAYKIMITLRYRFSTELYYMRRTQPAKRGKWGAKSTAFARHRNTWASVRKDECNFILFKDPVGHSYSFTFLLAGHKMDGGHVHGISKGQCG